MITTRTAVRWAWALLAAPALAVTAGATSLTLVVTNLPATGPTADGRVIACAGTLNGWDNQSTVATVAQGRLTYTFASLGALSALGTDWGDKPAGANAAFQFLVPGSWSDRAVKADFLSNDGNFRIALVDGAANSVAIDAGPAPTLVDQATAVRVNGAVAREPQPVDRTRFAFPGGRWKALVMSYDDGHVQDRGLASIFNRHGIRGTFHVNSGWLDTSTFITSAELPSLLAGHEVSIHTVDHPDLTQLGDGSVQWEIGHCRYVLSALAGYDVNSMSYPLGTYDERVMGLARGQNVTCSRTVQAAYSLDYLPSDYLKWHPTCHHADADGWADELIRRTGESMSLLFIWGHSYELDNTYANNSWAYMEALCQKLGNRGDIWYCGMGELQAYLAAIQALDLSSNVARNPSATITVAAKLGGVMGRLRPGARLAYPPGHVTVAPDVLREGELVTVAYQPAGNGLEGSTSLVLHVGHDGWQQTGDLAMTDTGNGTWTCAFSVPHGARRLDWAFANGGGVWDDRLGCDWSAPVYAWDTGTPAAVELAPGAPLVAAAPSSGQNNAGDAFDLGEDGGFLVTSNQGGFGHFGRVYVNGDDDNLYVGATGCDVAGSNNAMVIFLALDTLADGASNLWNLHGTPFGLDRLHNVGLLPAAHIAIVLGDEYGDATYPHFNLGNGYDFGQGAYYIASNATSFLPVPGARLSQFDGTGSVATAASDDDGNRLTDRWEIALPWSSLNAPLGRRSLASVHLSGVIAGSSTTGDDRYVSANYLGASAAGAFDAFGNYGFHFLSLSGHRVGLPAEDSDLDGQSDLHETMAGTNPADGSSLLKMARAAAGERVVQFDAVPGRRYCLQSKRDLESSEPWLDSAGPVTATGGVCALSAATGDEARVFYRVRLAATAE